ncbi:MAG: sulfotransferase family protein [Planctomycetota bacterium]|nr:MAG: sulfotransferase family protein [Planctomycetota bacterium]
MTQRKQDRPNVGPPEYAVRARRLAAAGRPREALASLEPVLMRDPNARPALRVAAEILIALGNPAGAMPYLDRLRSLAPDAPGVHLLAAQAEELLHRFEDAARSLERAHTLLPNNANPPALRARLAERANDLETARRWVGIAAGIDPEHPLTRLLDAIIRARTGHPVAAADILRRLADDPDAMQTLPPMMRASVCGELGRVLDKLGRYADAWSAFQQSHAHREQDPAWAAADADAAFARVRAAASIVADGFLDTCPPPMHPAPGRVVFMIGVPRSGTTLTERTLAAHPRVVATDEQSPLGAVITAVRSAGQDRSYESVLRSLDDAACERLRGLYFDQAARILGRLGPDSIVLDKLPLNLLDLPLIARVFPDAPLIMSLRDPLDSCLSNAQQQMVPNPSMKALGRLDTGSRFIAELLSLWLAARDTLRMRWTESRYEDFVTDPESHVRRLTAFLGLDWHDAMLDRSARTRGPTIATPSYEAVSGDITTRAVGRWSRYRDAISADLAASVETTLRPVRQALGYHEA